MERSHVVLAAATSILHRVRRGVFALNFWSFYCLILTLAIIQNGVWRSPQASYLWILSQDIFRNPFTYEPAYEWLRPSVLGPWMAYVTSANPSLSSYVFLHFLILLFGLSILAFMVRRRLGDFAARCLMVAFFAAPRTHGAGRASGAPTAAHAATGASPRQSPSQ